MPAMRIAAVLIGVVLAPDLAWAMVEAMDRMHPANVRVIERDVVVKTEYAPVRVASLEVHEIRVRGERTRVRIEEITDSKAVLVLFPGGKGVVKLAESGKLRAGKGNFLIRSRTYFLARGFTIAIPDGPSDHAKDLRYGFRNTDDHAMDVGAVIAHLRHRYGKPVWLLGTSRGSTSVAAVASRLAIHRPDGIVLTASVLVPVRNGNHLFDFDLGAIRMPVFIGHHREDACHVTPPGEVPALVRSLTAAAPLAVNWFVGGAPRGKACGSRSEHGFGGLERQVVDDIADWILAPKPN